MKLNCVKLLKSLLSVKIVVVTVLILSPFILFAQKADFAIFFSPEDAKSSNTLAEIIKGDENFQIIQCKTVEEIVSSDAKVLVLFMDNKEDKNFNKEQLEALKKYKIIGIDIGSAELFGRLGLEIKGGVHDYDNLSPKILPVKNPLLDATKYDKKIPVFKLASNKNPVDKNINYAMVLHAKSLYRNYVAPIATWKDRNYAPIVKQNNCLMVGLAAPVSTWTAVYKDFFHDISKAMRLQPLQPFTTAQWEITQPGTFSFTLAKSDDTKRMYSKNLYFKFKRPTNFKVRLEHTNTNHIAMNMSNVKEGYRETQNGEPLELDINISQADIDANGDKYWNLWIVNVDKHTADCKLNIEY